MTKMKKMISMIALSATALLLTGCSSEIPEGDASHFNSLPSFDELIVTKTYLPLKHPCMLHAADDINRVKGNLTASPWQEAWQHLQQSTYAQSSYKESTAALLDGYLKRMDANNWSKTYPDYNNYTALMRDAAATY